MVSEEVKSLSDTVAADLADFAVSSGLSKETIERMADDMEANWAYFNRSRFLSLCQIK